MRKSPILNAQQISQFLKDFGGTGGLQRLKAIVSIEVIRRQEFQEQFIALGLAVDRLISRRRITRGTPGPKRIRRCGSWRTSPTTSCS